MIVFFSFFILSLALFSQHFVLSLPLFFLLLLYFNKREAILFIDFISMLKGAKRCSGNFRSGNSCLQFFEIMRLDFHDYNVR